MIIAQLCQIGKLPFQILDYSSKSSVDCIVKWPPKQKKRDPDWVAGLEVERTLDGFFTHNHDFRTKPDICCWQIKKADFEAKKKKYMKDRKYVEKIELKEPEDAEHFKHQKELHFTIQEKHNVKSTHIIRVYVVSDIVKSLSSK